MRNYMATDLYLIHLPFKDLKIKLLIRPYQAMDSSSSICDQELLKRLIIDRGKLHDVLYGRWVEFGGRRPPRHAKQKLLQELPKDILKNIPSEVFLDVSTLSSGCIGVFAASEIEEKTVIGPLSGKYEVHLDNKEREATWELTDGKGCISSYLHTLDADTGSWMGLIQCARHPEEQNLEMFQDKSNVYYRVTKHIQVGEELLVWYTTQIPQYLGIPDFLANGHKEASSKTETDNPENCALSASDDERKRISCVLCHKGFNSRSNLRSHMRTHTNQKPFRCSTCGRRFSQSSTLRNHVRLHTGEKPYKCYTCLSAYSQLAGLRAHQKSSHHRPGQPKASEFTGE